MTQMECTTPIVKLNSSLCDSSDTYILVKVMITTTKRQGDGKEMKEIKQ